MLALLLLITPARDAEPRPPAAPEFIRSAWLVLGGNDPGLRDALPVGDGWAACVRVAPVPPYDPGPWIALTDGQRIPGRLVEVTGDSVTWRSPRLGDFTIPTEQIVAIRRRAGVPDEPGVVLVNGDTTGGVAALTPRGVRTSGAIGELFIACDRVASIRFRPDPPPARGLLLRLRRGGVLGAVDIAEVPGGLRVRLPRGRVGFYRADEVLALTRHGATLRPIGPPSSHRGSVTERSPGLLVRAPASAVWEQAPAAVVGVARSPGDASQVWADALVSLWAGSEMCLSARTSRARPAVALGAPAGAGPITLSVQPGTAGDANGVVELFLAVVEIPPTGDES